MESNNKYLDHFVDGIRNNIDADNLSNMNRNLATLDYRVRKINPYISFNSVVSGVYDSKKNRIDIFEENEAIIYHELLHMASSIYKNKKRYEGLCDMSLDIDNRIIGIALNEGYTEVLARRLFNINSTVCNGYEYAVYIAQLLEIIIGKDNMERYYFNANLPGLIDDLSKYNSLNQVIDFIEACDFVLGSLDKSFIKFRREAVWTKLGEINKFLSTTYARKMYNLYKQKSISKEVLIKEMFKYNSLLVDDRYEITTQEDINGYLRELFGLSDKSILKEYKLIRVKDN